MEEMDGKVRGGEVSAVIARRTNSSIDFWGPDGCAGAAEASTAFGFVVLGVLFRMVPRWQTEGRDGFDFQREPNLCFLEFEIGTRKVIWDM